MTDEQAVRYLADELFIATDQKDWDAVRALFVDGPIEVDMSSLAGGGPARMTADDLVAGFRTGLHAGKASHHLAANYRVTVDADRAELWAHGYAWNRVAALPPGEDLWETWGNYRLTCRRGPRGWRLDGFRYYSKLTRGNDAVRTHQG
jgi:SnoaL-like domain